MSKTLNTLAKHNQHQVPVETLTNIGKTVARNLNLIGIRTRADLEAATPVSAYLHLCDNFPNKTWPKCYYLYSLEGALTDTHWDDLPEAKKQALISEVSRRRSRLTLPAN